jgi:membrane protease YdiL (CAAX protease family)
VKGKGSASTRERASTSSEPSRRSIPDPGIARDSQFGRLAVAGEAGLALLAVGLGRLLGMSPLAQVQPGWGSFLWGVLATPPLLLVLIWALKRPHGSLRRLVDFVVGQLGPILSGRSTAELALLAVLAGVGEELLFRGVVQAGLARLVPNPLALLCASVFFGLAHFATSTYAVVAGLMGLYLGGLFLVQGSLLAPIVTHALYDLVALLLVVQRYRASQVGPALA